MTNRRQFLKLGASTALAGRFPTAAARSNSEPKSLSLEAVPAAVNLVGDEYPDTPVWTYNGTIPGQQIRLRHGQQLQVTVKNALPQPTSVHWHGIRLPNAMDGVAGLTQAPIEPGQSFEYRFTPPDAGTYWYHAHLNTPEQIGRGLYGALIIEEQQPVIVDRELVWIIDDWRLNKQAVIIDDFDNRHDRSHAGRIGNAPTLNGRYKPTIPVRSGERLRIRIINAANARNFALNLDALTPSVIALDGQPSGPYTPDGAIVLGASGRTDLIVDMSGDPGSRSKLIDNYYPQPYLLATFAYSDEPPLREHPLDTPISAGTSALPQPDLGNAVKQQVVMRGGAMGGMQRGMLDGNWIDLRELAARGYLWTVNDITAHRLDMPPLLSVERGQSVILEMHNDTAFEHPMHLHGHHLKVLSVDGKPPAHEQWRDSPLLKPRQKLVAAFVADNPGNWLFHCHILEHHASGLGALVRVV